MKQIEVKLHELHAQSRSDATADPMEVNGEHHAVNYVAFARIDHVDDGSPASSAVTELCYLSILLSYKMRMCDSVILYHPLHFK